MTCPKCKGPMSINSQGALTCLQCVSVKRSLVVSVIQYNDFEAYRTIKSHNLVVDEYLVKEEVEDLINQGVQVEIKA